MMDSSSHAPELGLKPAVRSHIEVQETKTSVKAPSSQRSKDSCAETPGRTYLHIKHHHYRSSLELTLVILSTLSEDFAMLGPFRLHDIDVLFFLLLNLLAEDVDLTVVGVTDRQVLTLEDVHLF